MPIYISGLEVRLTDGTITENPDNDLSIDVVGFKYEIAGEKGSYAGTINQSITDDVTNYVYMTNSGVLGVNATSFPASESHIRLGRVVVASGVLDIIDDRAFLHSANDSPLTTKGDIYAYDTGDARLPVGASGQVLSAEPSVTLGLKWITNGGQTDTVTGSNGITNTGDNTDAILTPTYGSSANTICQGNDSRLSDARTPTSHATSHQSGGSDEINHAHIVGSGTNTHAQIDTHLSNTSNPHSTDIGNLGSGTLAELNSAVSDATLDDSGDSRDPNSHATSHESGGSDEINHAHIVGSGTNTHAQIDTHLSNTSNPHSTDIGNLGSGTLAELNSAVSDATLDDSGDSRDPNSHATSHESGGSDEINHAHIVGSGTNTHAQIDTHLSNTSNPHSTDIGNLGSGTLAELNSAVSDATLDDSGDSRDPNSHATSHQSGGGDSIKLDDLAAPDDNTDLDASTSKHGLLKKLGGGTTNFLRADGSWAAPPGTASPLTTKGDIYAYDTGDARLPVGASGQVLSAEPSVTLGLKWITNGGQTDTVTGSNGITNTGDNTDAILTPTYGSSANTICQGNDSRLSDARTPTSHATSHQSGGSDEINHAHIVGSGTNTHAQIDTHLSNTSNPHSTDIGNLGSGTLAELNSAVSDATLDDSGDSRDPNSHATSHESGGSDEINHAHIVGSGTNTHAQIDTHLSNTSNPHSTDIGNLGSGTLAELNSAVSDATLDDSGDSRDPNSHATSHESGGSDEINHAHIVGSGTNTHAQIDTHLSNTSNPHSTDIGNLGSGTLAELNSAVSDATLDDSGDSRDPNSHATSHQSGGGDSIKLDDLAAPDDNTDLDASTSKHGLLKKLGGGTTNFLRADGSWAAPPGTASPLTTKGDIYAYDTGDARLPVGASGQVLSAEPSVTLGLKWITNSGSGGQTDTVTGSNGITNTGDNTDAILTPTYGSSANTICQGNDSRLSDARTPTSHATSHQSGGGDSIKLDDLAAPDDNTDLDASTSKHGLLKKLGGGTTNFLRADGSWAAPAGGSSPLTTKGDLYTYSTDDARLPVGASGQILSAGPNETTGLKWVDTGGTGFGSEFFTDSKAGESSTTNIAWTEYFSTTTPPVPSGQYMVLWCAIGECDNDRGTLGVRPQVDSIVDLVDTTGTWDYVNVTLSDLGSSNNLPLTGFKKVTLTAATHTLDIYFRHAGSGTSYLRGAVFAMWRIS